jgi:glucose/arabinose dehydrogenase
VQVITIAADSWGAVVICGEDNMRQSGGITTLSAAVTLLLGLAFVTPARGQLSNPVVTGAGNERIRLQPIATVPGEPLDLVHANDGSNRLFVATHNGQVRLIKDNALQTTSFLDLSARGVTVVGGSGNDERGLLGLAFHPSFNAPVGTPGRGKLYTYTSEAVSGNADFTHPEIGPTGGNHQSVIREWTVDSTSPDQVTTPSREVMRIAEPQANHNGGAMRFDTAGNLLISLGDGGGGNDFSGGANNATDGHTNNTGNGQDTSNVYGKILRINPTGTGSANGKYGIPAGNPFVAPGNAGLDEILVYGLRNPFRMNFDRGTGNLYIGDVGQGQREEVDIVRPTDGGNNYGWPYLEGTLDNPNYGPDGAGTVVPIGEYTHADGVSIIGGSVYRGTAIPALQGKYIFGEFRGPAAVGRLFYMDALGGVIREFNFDTTGGGVTPTGNLYGFGEDASGELYALFQNGTVARIVPEPAGLSLVGVALLLAGRRRRRHAA